MIDVSFITKSHIFSNLLNNADLQDTFALSFAHRYNHCNDKNSYLKEYACVDHRMDMLVYLINKSTFKRLKIIDNLHSVTLSAQSQ